MKIFVIHATAGAGHTKCAEAISNYLRNRMPKDDIRLIDVLEKSNPLFRFNYKWGYPSLVKWALWLWGFLFWITYYRPLRFLSRKNASVFNTINTLRFSWFLIKENPDFIISTHFLSAEIACLLKNHNKIKSKLITVITDFGVHPFWINSGTDLYIVASGATKNELIKEGIDKDIIIDSGIPVNERFLIEHDSKELAKKYGIKDGVFTVLIMTGSFGLGPIEEVVDILSKDVQVIVICAANKKLYQRLRSKSIENVKVFGYVDNPDNFMSLSDLIITKAGGLTVSETLNMGLAPIFISVIPGQEKTNVNILSDYGIGFSPKDCGEIRDIVLDLKSNPEKLNLIKQNISRLKKPDCLKEIFDVVCKSGSGVKS